jgi:DNA-binding NarL/FixJ family response regulator
MIRLLVVDDHPIVRAGLVALFALDDDIEVIAEASTPDEAVAVAERANPDVVLMDLQFGAGTAGSGAEATRRIRALDAPPYVLVLTNYDSDADILGAVEAGASGYLLKDAPPHELSAAVRAAAAGESALAPVIATRLLQRMRAPKASELFVSETTVKSHLAHIYTKLDATSRTAAVSEARHRGILR